MSFTDWDAVGGSWQVIGASTSGGGTSPTTHKPVMGASTDSPTGTTYAALEAQVGATLVHRTYGAAPTSFLTTNANADVTAGRWSLFSMKLTPTATATAYNSQFSAFIDTIPSGHKTTLFVWHEPEDDVAAGTFTAAQWCAMQASLGGVLQAKARTELTYGIALENYTFQTASGRNPSDYFSTAMSSVVDYICTDTYNRASYSQGAVSGWVSMATLAGQFMPFIRAQGKRTMLTEYGCAYNNAQPSAKPAWMSAAYQWGISEPLCDAMCWFDCPGELADTTVLLENDSGSTSEFMNEVADSKV